MSKLKIKRKKSATDKGLDKKTILLLGAVFIIVVLLFSFA